MLRLAGIGTLGPWLCFAAACSSPSATQAGAPPAAAPASPWQLVMQGVDTRLDGIGRQLQSPGKGDLRQVADAARAAAEAIARGYGDLEQKDLPGFAGMSRETESWLLQLGLEAGQGHGDLAAELFSQRELRYCTRCHDVAQQHGRRIGASRKAE